MFKTYEASFDDVLCVDASVALKLVEVGEQVRKDFDNNEYFYSCFIDWVVAWCSNNNLDIDENVYTLLNMNNELARRVGLNLLDELMKMPNKPTFKFFTNLLFDPGIHADERSDLISTFYTWFSQQEVEPVLVCLMDESAPPILNVASFYLVQGRQSVEDDAGLVEKYLDDSNPFLRVRALCSSPYAFVMVTRESEKLMIMVSGKER